MIPIGGRPLLEHGVRLLRQHGFDELVVNLSHLPDAIRDHFGDGRRFGVSIRYSHEPELLGTAGALQRVAAAFAGDDLLVTYADNLTNADLGTLWQQHRRCGALATVGLLWLPDPETRGIVGLDGTGRIDRWREKPAAGEVFADYLINGGIYALRPEALADLPARGDFALDVMPRWLEDGRHLHGHRLQGQLLSTDTPERYAAARRAVDAGLFRLP